MKLLAVLLATALLASCAAPGPKTIDGMTLEEILAEPYTADQL